MNYADIKERNIANGPGVRVNLFVSGCEHYCKNCFNKEAWDMAFEENGLSCEQYAHRRIAHGEPLAWQHMDSLVSFDYLEREHDRAKAEIVTRDCRKGCNGCFGTKCREYCDIHRDGTAEVNE